MSRRAFSLIEMIVVIGILIVLLSILMPVVGSARDAANGTLCASHIRTLTQGFLLFAQDHDGHLPGNVENTEPWHDGDPNPDHWDWLYGQYAWYAWNISGAGVGAGGPPGDNQLKQLLLAPQYGTLWKYINNNSYAGTNLPGGGSYQTYLCPSLTMTIPGGGSGSNGRFDYAAFAAFDGAMIKDIPATSIMHTAYNTTNVSTAYPPASDQRWSGPIHQWSTQYAVLPTPLICQEDAAYNINKHGGLDGQHGGTDQMTHIHHGGSFYGSVDGNVTWVNEPDIDLYQLYYEGAALWEAVPPTGGTPVLLDYIWYKQPYSLYGKWNCWANANNSTNQ